MEPPSTGVKLELCKNGNDWESVEEVFLTEATEYLWRCTQGVNLLSFQGMPLQYTIEDSYKTGKLLTPFQSGEVRFVIGDDEVKNYVYPDSRKVTNDQFELMLRDILEEASVCFDFAGAHKMFDASGRTRTTSWIQWSYINRHFDELTRFFNQIKRNPLRKLNRDIVMEKRERIKFVTTKTIAWLDRNGYAVEVPERVLSERIEESYDIYENRLIKKHLYDLRLLLLKYREFLDRKTQIKASEYLLKIGKWLRSDFLASVSPLKEIIVISQKIRKQPHYRSWYQWFEKLYEHKNLKVGIGYNLPLKDTFEVYEIWCYMQLVGYFRNRGLLKDATNLYRLTSDGIFLDLHQHNKSLIELKNGANLYYQKNYQFNSPDYYTFTQRMVPDIVIECRRGLIILDPKYRIGSNIGKALGEMHKYKDGILSRDSNKKVVEHVSVLTPDGGNQEELRFYKVEFHETYQMGAHALAPGKNNELALNQINLLVDNLSNK